MHSTWNTAYPYDLLFCNDMTIDISWWRLQPYKHQTTYKVDFQPFLVNSLEQLPKHHRDDQTIAKSTTIK